MRSNGSGGVSNGSGGEVEVSVAKSSISNDE